MKAEYGISENVTSGVSLSSPTGSTVDAASATAAQLAEGRYPEFNYGYVGYFRSFESIGNGGFQLKANPYSQYGYARMFYVLANTAQRKSWDGRISRDNKDWAKTIPVFEDKDYFGDDRRSSFEVDACNPGLTDIFINQARREYLLTQPLTKEDIQSEAVRLLRRLQAEHEPNSPGGTHFMAQISPDFLIRASMKDHDRLFALLPFKSLSFSTLKDRNGIFAFIQKDENRNQLLRLRKPSVRDQLREMQAASKPPAASKDKEIER